jgi:ubiquinone/menaquinone biosynthesis C-methylase UbiE
MNLERGQKRWNVFLRKAKQYFNPTAGSCLDLGCGRGEFVIAGLKDGYDIFGLDVELQGINQFNQAVTHYLKRQGFEGKCLVYDGEHIPFSSERFLSIHSWFVLEHIPNLEVVLREIVRVTQGGGFLILDAQDARTFYEGHANIPWLPFMPKSMIPAWLEVFGCEDKIEYVMNSCFYITTPRVATILEACGCDIIYQSSTPKELIPNHANIYSRDDLIKLAHEVKKQWENHQWPPVQENLQIVARKRNTPY